MFKPLILLTIISFVSSHDVIVGTNTEGRKIYDENRHASPTIWRQTENVTITTTDAEVISRVVITDRRPDKDGDVKVVDGGVGQKNVTLELKSPTVLRGYDFQIEVYSIPEDKFKSGVKDVPNLDQTRVQRDPAEDRNKPTSFPRAVDDEPKKQDSTSKNNPTSSSTDTKVNHDTKTTNDDSVHVDEQKQSSGPVPFVGNRPQTFHVPITEPIRHAREAFNPEIPEENQSSQKKTDENQDEAGNFNAFTHRPSLISRQSSLNKPTPQSVSTNKPDHTNDGQRNARDAEENDKKNGNDYTTPKADLPNSRAFPTHPKMTLGSAPIVNAKDESKRDAKDTEHETKNEDQNTKRNTNVANSRLHPALIDEKSFSASATKKPDHEGKRVARDTEIEKTNEEGNISTQQPALVPRLSTFNKPTFQSVSTNKPDNLNGGKRDSRDSEDDTNSGSANTTPKANVENNWTYPSVPRRSFESTPQVGVKSFSTSTSKPDNEGKRDARDTDHANNSKVKSDANNNKSYPQHPALIPRENTFNRPTIQSVSTTSKPDISNNGKRNARDADDNDNTTPKVGTSRTYPANPKISSFDGKAFSTSTKKPENTNEDKRDARDTEHNHDVSSKTDGKASSNPKTVATQSAPTQDKTTETKNEDNENSRPRPLFVPPPGYQRVVTANLDEKDRFARDVDSNEKQDTNRKDQSSSTEQPFSKNDGLKRVPPSLGVQYRPLPYSTQVTTTTASPTTKSQNKRDTEPEVSQTEGDKFKTVPRIFGEQNQNSTTSKPNPVISVQ